MGSWSSGGGLSKANLDWGSDLLPSGNSTVLVAHALGATPTSVQVTPKAEAAISANTPTDSDFTVERGSLSTGDIEFWWLVLR